MKEEKTVSIDTMVGIGKDLKLAGRDYKVLPVNIKDMSYILSDIDDKLIIVPRNLIEADDTDVTWQIYGLNIIDEQKKKIFMKMLNKYVFYKEIPMTEEMLVEHGWSFREIGEFLLQWCGLSE